MGSTQGNILVIRGGAIGDFILTLPVLSALRQHFPRVRLEILGYPHIAHLALAGRLADHVRSIEAAPLAGFFARNGALDEAHQHYFGTFDIIISYLYDLDKVFQANVARCSKAQFLAGPHRPDERAGIHATKVFLSPLERLSIFDADPVPRLRGGRGDAETKKPVENPFEPIFSASSTLAFHPGSGSERKNWPEAKWAELLRELIRTTEMQLLLVGGEAEGERLTRLAKPLPASRVQLARSLPLSELAQRLAACAAFVGHDSGITHLAAAVGLPALVLWGESVEAVWRPQGGQLTILKAAGGLNEMDSSTVLDRLLRLLRLKDSARLPC